MNKSLKKQFENLKPGAHIALLYNQKVEWATAISEFIAASVERNEKIIYVGEEYSDKFIKMILKNNNIDINRLIKKGQLAIFPRKQIYESEFNSDIILELLKKEAKKAEEEKYESFNITGEISFLLKQKNNFKKIIEYERKVEEKLFKQYSVKALCRYNVALFDEKIIKNIIKLHPYIVWQNRLYKNPYHISLDSFNSENIYKKELKEWLNNIKDYQKEKDKYSKELKEEKSKFEFVFNEIKDAIFVQGFTEDAYAKFEMVNQKACKLLGYKQEELLDKRPIDILSQESLINLKTGNRRQKLLDGKKIKFNVDMVTKSGEKISVENNAHVFEYKGKKLVLTVTRDIREKLKKEKKLNLQYRELKEKNKSLKILNMRLNKLLSIITELSQYSIKDENKFLQNLFNTSFEIIPQAELGSVYLYKNNQVYFLDTIGHNKRKLNSAKIDINNFKKYNEVTKEKNIDSDLSSSISQDKYKIFIEGSKEIKETLAFDIKANNEYIGGISLDIEKDSSNKFNDISIKVFSAFKDIAESFYKIQSYDKLRGEFTKELALSLIHMLEFHDKYTIGHSENVALLAGDFAEYLNLDEKEISRIYWAGLVHDIGKTIIPSYILNKEGKLTEQEYEIIKNHPYWAYETLIRSKQLSDIAKYVLYHHERIDGNGYPEGLKGDNIPYISQILSICDSWDAMRSNRSYRDALSYNQAIKELQDNKDQQHSSELVDKFISMLNSENNELFFHK